MVVARLREAPDREIGGMQFERVAIDALPLWFVGGGRELGSPRS
jgi:hypothetical protein